MRARPLLVALLLTLGPALGAPQDGLDTIRDFKKYFKKYKEPAQRVEAVLALDGIDLPETVDTLLPLLKDADPDVVEAVLRVLGTFEERPAIDRLIAVLAEEKSEVGRLGILRSLERGAYGGLGESVALCLQDRSWAVRRAAILAVTSGGGGERAALILPLCADPEIAVRCAAFDALALLAAPEARASAVAALADPSWQVRSSAIRALGVVRHRDSIPILIERMEVEDGRLIADIGNALDAITGRALGTRLELWQRFWEANGAVYQIPTDAELAELRRKQAEHKALYEGAKGQVTYHGIDTPSRKVLFVIDVSGSMENEVSERERFAGGGYPSLSRMDIVKTELQRTIENLEDYVEFNILAFATDVTRWKKGLTRANVLQKTSAIDWVGRLEPLGGSSQEDLARVGLGGAANLESGKTNTWGALAAALEIGEGAKPTEDYELDLDTVFFLSDGKPTFGDRIEINEILMGVLEANALRRVVIHTIAIGQFDKSFMERLARENGGVFVDLGK